MQDIYYNNNANAFVVNSQTVAESIKRNTFILECHYLKPEIQNNQIINTWHRALVRFQDLIHNNVTNQIYYFDYQSNYNELTQKLGAQRIIYKKVKIIQIS